LLAAQFNENYEFKDYPKEMMLNVLNQKVVCGAQKNCYQTSCYKRRDGTTGIKSYDVETALDYPFIYYSTTFKRNNVFRSEIIKTFIIDVDYLPLCDLKQMHKLISEKVLTPTFTTCTTKGYQFMFVLSTPLILSEKGISYAKSINNAIIDKFEEIGIEVDHSASSRLSSTFRNPLVHQFEFSNLTYSSDELKDHFKLNHTIIKNKSVSSALINTSGTSDKYLSQKEILDNGYKVGNRNEYFYLLANKECVIQDINSYNDSLMVCNLVADDLSYQNPNAAKIPDSEIKATAAQLYKYKNNNSLYMPTVFCSSKRNISTGKYRKELNDTVGYCDISIRRSEAMKFLQRDRKEKTIKKIAVAIRSLSTDDFNDSSIYSLSIKISLLLSNISASSIYKYIKDDTSLLSSTLTLDLYKINVLDFMEVPEIGVLNVSIYHPVNSVNYKSANIDFNLCISKIEREKIDFYRRI